MALREFVDSTGRPWRVWDVRPAKSQDDRRLQERRNPEPLLLYRGPERRAKERRIRNEYRRILPLKEWLVFESGEEKRRLVPVPGHWDHKSDSELEELARCAQPVDQIVNRN